MAEIFDDSRLSDGQRMELEQARYRQGASSGHASDEEQKAIEKFFKTPDFMGGANGHLEQWIDQTHPDWKKESEDRQKEIDEEEKDLQPREKEERKQNRNNQKIEGYKPEYFKANNDRYERWVTENVSTCRQASSYQWYAD